VPEPAAAAVAAAAERPAPRQAEKPEKKPKKRKKRKGLFSRALEEVWDKVEDIFD
jgi:ribosomal protein L12E/L44/L45/RPP1/RPP2